MKKFIVYLLVIVMTVSLGFAVFFLVRDNEVISISHASMYRDVNDTFSIDLQHLNKKSSTEITISSSDDGIVSYNEDTNKFTANKGGVARINFRTNNAKFRNLWCDVIVGDGTSESPFYISTAEQLSAIGMGAETGENTDIFKGAGNYSIYTSDSCYKLVDNIDVSTINDGYWMPLQNFKGRFDGNGYTISNVNIDKVAYTERFENEPTYTPFPVDEIGFFRSIDRDAKVYNVKFENYSASGEYNTFGTLAGINYGIVERIEVKDAFLGVETTTFGGLVGKNITDEQGSGSTYARTIARIDRSSVNFVLGKKYDGTELVTVGNLNTIGGLVGINNGGNVLYSYAKGEVFFGRDDNSAITYGGVVAENNVLDALKVDGAYNSSYQGANIKDCYSDIKTNLMVSLQNASSKIAGVVAINVDNSTEDKDNIQVVNNYIVGTYYNKDNLKFAQDGISKKFKGVHTFNVDGDNLEIADSVGTVYGLTEEEMKDASKFISHYTKELKINEDGSYNEVAEEEVSWLFDTVWVMDSAINDGKPYLNYQLVYIPDDFRTVGTPVVDDYTEYKFIVSIDYPIEIVGDTDGKIRIPVGSTYTGLGINPKGVAVTWTWSNNDILEVGTNGTVYAKKIGVSTITATTNSGYSDTITAIVEEVSYEFINYPREINVEEGKTVQVTGITVKPATTLSYAIQYTGFAEVDNNGVITGKMAGKSTYLFVTAGKTRIAIRVNILAKSDNGDENVTKVANITVSPSTVSQKITETKTGKINATATVNGASVNGLTYSYISSNNDIVKVDGMGNYTICGTGNAYIATTVTTNGYVGSAYTYFEITEDKTNDEVAVFSLNATSKILNEGETFKLVATGTTNQVNYRSSNTKIATVDANGLVTAIGTDEGNNTAVISAYVKNNDGSYSYAYCTITIVETPAVITISPASSQVYVGDEVTLTATCNKDESLTWTYLNENFVEIANIADYAEITTVSANIKRIKLTTDCTIVVNVKNSSNTTSAQATIVASKVDAYKEYIYNASQLNAIRNNLSEHYYLAADIDLNGINWTPIGTLTSPFTGSIKALEKCNGEYYSISNVTTTNNTYSGLFGYIKNADISNLTIKNISSTGIYAGGIAGYAYCSGINNCNVIGAVIKGERAAGCIVGATYSSSTVSYCSVTGNVNIQGTSSSNVSSYKYVGGIVGNTRNSTINNSLVNITGNITTVANTHAYVGGVAGYSSSLIIASGVSGANISANNSDLDYAGGIVGYSTYDIKYCTVKSVNISGYYAGGIGGALNISSEVSLTFDNYKNGFLKSDLKTFTYTNNVQANAVKETTNVKGNQVGGLFAVINSGVVSSSYTRANLNGTSADSEKAGFAVIISSTGLTNAGGKGQAGIVENCYSACTFSGSGKNYSITKSSVHSSVSGNNTRTAGYVFNYVFDNDLDGNAEYSYGSNILSTDKVQAKKSTKEMKSLSTYTSKSFSATYWNLTEGNYPTLKIEF